MFAIGEFARLAQVTVKTLRYYDEAGLLKPAHVDRDSGYRYYKASQLPRLNRILVLKELGFSLDQIATLLDEGVNEFELQGDAPSSPCRTKIQNRRGEQPPGCNRTND